MREVAHFSIALDNTFYRCQELVNEGGVDALINKSKRVSNLKNRVAKVTE